MKMLMLNLTQKAGKNRTGKQQYRCKECLVVFVDPKTRKITKSKRKKTKRTAEDYRFFDPNILCCPSCGNKDVVKNGSDKGKTRYKCNPCQRCFVDPRYRKQFGYTNALEDNPDVSCYNCGKRNFRYGRKHTVNGQERRDFQCLECNKSFIHPKYKFQQDIICRFCSSSRCVKAGFLAASRKQRYSCYDCKKSFTIGALKEASSTNLPLSDDVWDARSLGVKIPPTRSATKFVFTKIYQLWLKNLAKKLVKFLSSNKSYSTISHHIVTINQFSEFLLENYPEINSMEEINRDIVLDFVSWINSRDISTTTLVERISKLKIFIEHGNINGWFKTSRYLIMQEDYPRKPKSLPRYIPNHVLAQLNQHLDNLPDPVMRMVLVLQECGMRYTEMATLSFNCIDCDAKGNWLIKFTRHKMSTEDILPISKELANVIQEQQSYLKDYFGSKNKYLFTAGEVGYHAKGQGFIPSKNKVMNGQNFCIYLNNLARKFNIAKANGELWHFESHQFRHTVGTQMINNGVPQHIVQRYLGHESPTMTMTYAHIHDETLRQEIAKFYDTKVIDITGQAILPELEADEKDTDLEWFTKKIAAVALPNGYCARPKILGDCDIPGDIGCYICPYFRTNKNFLEVHREQLERVEKVLEKAQKYNWQLPILKNKPIKENLELIITALEGNNNEQ